MKSVRDQERNLNAHFGLEYLDDVWSSLTIPSPFDTILGDSTIADQQILQSSPDSTGQETSNHRESEAQFTQLNPPQSHFSAGHSSRYVPDSSFAGNDYQPPSIQSPPSAEITDIEGSWLFKVRHPREDNDKAPAKGISWTYSWALEELYVKMDVDCPFIIHTEGTPPLGSIIRATPYYRRAEDKNDVPQRCLHHSAVEHETNRGHDNVDHVIRSDHQNAFYEKDATGRMSTVVPFFTPGMGVNSGIYLYRFMCRTSCVGGMNRRPICIVFTLELNGQILGRQVRLVKVSACPGRDCKKNEVRSGKDLSASARSAAQTSEVNSATEGVRRAVKRISSNLQNMNHMTSQEKRQKTYSVTCTNRRNYNILSALLPILERCLSNQDSHSVDEEDKAYSPVAVVPEILGPLMCLVPEPERELKKEPEESKEPECVIPTTADKQTSPAVHQPWITLFSQIDEIVKRATSAITEGRPFPNTLNPSPTTTVKTEKMSPDSKPGCEVECSTSSSIRSSNTDRGFSIKSWLSSLHLSGYLGQFLSRGFFCGSQLQDITMMDLSEMGIAEEDCDILWKSLISWWCRNSRKVSRQTLLI